MIAVSSIGAKTFSALMGDCIMAQHVLESDIPCFPRYPLDPLLRVIPVSLKTLGIVTALSAHNHEAKS